MVVNATILQSGANGSRDGKNTNTAAMIGTAPGDSDFDLDFTPGVDTGPGGIPTAPDCE
jgi:hypothetical protein